MTTLTKEAAIQTIDADLPPVKYIPEAMLAKMRGHEPTTGYRCESSWCSEPFGQNPLVFDASDLYWMDDGWRCSDCLKYQYDKPVSECWTLAQVMVHP